MLTTAEHYEKLAHMEWCSVFEPGIGSGVSTQAQKQQLLNGYPGVLWEDAAPPAPAVDIPGGSSDAARQQVAVRLRRQLVEDEELVALIAAITEIDDGQVTH